MQHWRDWQHGMLDLFLSFDLDRLEDETFQLMPLTQAITYKQANRNLHKGAKKNERRSYCERDFPVEDIYNLKCCKS